MVYHFMVDILNTHLWYDHSRCDDLAEQRGNHKSLMEKYPSCCVLFNGRFVFI